MAKYQASAEYVVYVGKNNVTFDRFGFYETDDSRVIKALDALVPRYIQRVDEPEADKPDTDAPVPEGKPIVEPKPAQTQRKKPGAKTPASGK